jgi:hypothetical protein
MRLLKLSFVFIFLLVSPAIAGVGKHNNIEIDFSTCLDAWKNGNIIWTEPTQRNYSLRVFVSHNDEIYDIKFFAGVYVCYRKDFDILKIDSQAVIANANTNVNLSTFDANQLVCSFPAFSMPVLDGIGEDYPCEPDSFKPVSNVDLVNNGKDIIIKNAIFLKSGSNASGISFKATFTSSPANLFNKRNTMDLSWLIFECFARNDGGAEFRNLVEFDGTGKSYDLKATFYGYNKGHIELGNCAIHK